MIKALLSPKTTAEEWAIERDKIAARKPHLSLVVKDPRPDPDMYVWRDPAELFERKS
jgi:hypothetical protein